MHTVITATPFQNPAEDEEGPVACIKCGTMDYRHADGRTCIGDHKAICEDCNPNLPRRATFNEWHETLKCGDCFGGSEE